MKHLSRFLPVLLLALTSSHSGAADRPNLVFILADDLGWADTELYGHTSFYKTPNLQRLAARGMTFTRAYAASPLCSPTRASILTGQNPARTGITAPNCHLADVILDARPGAEGNPGAKSVPPVPPTRLRTEHYTLAEALKDAGYATAHFGKWHLGRDPYSPRQHGFDIDIPHWFGPGPAGSYVAPWKFPDFDPDTPDQHLEDRMAKEAVAFLERHRAGDTPFFLNYWMFSVHAPFDAKRDLIEKYRKTAGPRNPQRSPTYAAMVESMDDAVGTLLDALDRLALSDNTLIVFFSDNGGNMYNEVDGTTPTSNAPLRGGKATVFEGGIRVPCVIAWPGHVRPQTRSDAIIQSDDFYPTILELLKIDARDGQRFDGMSIAPALDGKPLERRAIFTYFPHNPPVPDWLPPSVAATRGDWKLIRLFNQGEGGAHRYKLFNLSEDIGEKHDLAAAKPDLVGELDALITGFLTETHAVLPTSNPAFDPAAYRPENEGKAKGRKVPAAAPAASPADAALQGWKARNCEAAVKAGIVTIQSQAQNPFLGVGAGTSGPATIRLKLRAINGGDGKIEWLRPGTPPGSAPFRIDASGDWQEKQIEIPASGALGILRVYLPAVGQAVEIDWIELKPSTGKSRRWGF